MSKWRELDEHSMWHQVDSYFRSTQKQKIYNLRAWTIGFMFITQSMRKNIDYMESKEFIGMYNDDGSPFTFGDCQMKLLIVDSVYSLVVDCLHNHNQKQAVSDVKYVLSHHFGIEFDKYVGDLTVMRFMCYVALQELRWDYLPLSGGYCKR
jgi:hypothetical protein